MSDMKLAFRNLRTGEVVSVRQVKTPRGTILEPDIPEEVTAPGTVPSDWVPGVIGPTGSFHPTDQSVSFILKFPQETTAELDELIKESGGDATQFFKRAVALYKLARDAVHEGKAVGIASSPDLLETRFTGL